MWASTLDVVSQPAESRRVSRPSIVRTCSMVRSIVNERTTRFFLQPCPMPPPDLSNVPEIPTPLGAHRLRALTVLLTAGAALVCMTADYNGPLSQREHVFSGVRLPRSTAVFRQRSPLRCSSARSCAPHGRRPARSRLRKRRRLRRGGRRWLADARASPTALTADGAAAERVEAERALLCWFSTLVVTGVRAALWRTVVQPLTVQRWRCAAREDEPTA